MAKLPFYAFQLKKMNEKMEVMMQAIVLLEKRVTLVEDQLKITSTNKD